MPLCPMCGCDHPQNCPTCLDGMSGFETTGTLTDANGEHTLTYHFVGGLNPHRWSCCYDAGIDGKIIPVGKTTCIRSGWSIG